EKLESHSSPEKERSLNRRKTISKSSRGRKTTRKHECAVCGKCFRTPSLLRRHESVGTYGRETLRVHERVHTAEKPYKCRFCFKSFAQTSQLASHERIHSSDKPFECRFCEKQFKWIKNLRVHYRIQTNERPFECHICSKRFSQSSDLKKHTRVHTGEKPYRCQLCPSSFVQSNNLKDHLRSHTGETPFECDVIILFQSVRLDLFQSLCFAINLLRPPSE
ncbi:unnamed protein product, partial [Cyprideis torosa]